MRYDVAIIGGSLSGAAAATLLLREHPDLKVIIIEKSPKFTRRVGEATVEISGFFLGRVLGMTSFMNETQIVKQGMRFWFANEETKGIPDASEIGPRYHVRLPAFQLDRAVFDEEVLRRACVAGAELARPASVSAVKLSPGGDQTLTIKRDGATDTIQARWVIDASGVAALLARQEGWWKSNTDHPTAACWSRWKGVKDWDGRELAEKYPEWADVTYGIRGTATNHIVGDGWWSWWIPLKGGDVSVGVVFDQRLVEWPQDGGNLGERLKAFLTKHPVARELLADAHYAEDDVLWRKNLAYNSDTFVGDGFALVGDALAFLDPFYSPGMDWISFSVSSAVDVILAQRKGEALAPKIAHYNKAFARSYHKWFEAIYKDKYEYIGEYDLFKMAFQMDLGLYYLGIVSQPFRYGRKALLEPPFVSPVSWIFFKFMSGYNRRFAKLARRRRKLGLLGGMNTGQRLLIDGYTLNWGDISKVLKVILKWGRLEISDAMRCWGRSAPKEPARVATASPVASTQ